MLTCIQASSSSSVRSFQEGAISSSSKNPIVGRLFAVPSPNNQFFHGREDVLSEINDSLSYQENQGQLRSYLIHGIAGLGKTQVALEYAHRHQRDYDYIFWLKCHPETALARGFAIIARKIKLTEGYSSNLPQVAEAVKDWLNATRE